MSEMIKSAPINCFSMCEERSSSYLLPHPLPPRPHVFDAEHPKAHLVPAVWIHLRHTFIFPSVHWDFLLHSSLQHFFFFPPLRGTEMRSEHGTFWVKAQGHEPSKLIQKFRVVEVTLCKIYIGWDVSCLCTSICDLFLWKALSSTRYISDRIHQDLNYF